MDLKRMGETYINIIVIIPFLIPIFAKDYEYTTPMVTQYTA